MKRKTLFLILFILIFFISVFFFNIFNNKSDEKTTITVFKMSSTSKDDIITFIIPSIGRDTLPETIKSLQNLNSPKWNAIIVFDGVEPTIQSDDPRISILKLDKKIGEKKNNAGRVRNCAFPYVRTEWVGFVDDDDLLEPTYIDRILEYSKDNYDVIIFRMKYMKNDFILPPMEDVEKNEFKKDYVGISFCLRTSLTDTFKFEPSNVEDFNLLSLLRSNHKKIKMSPYIEYIVR